MQSDYQKLLFMFYNAIVVMHILNNFSFVQASPVASLGGALVLEL
jgi:hypothetical protein